jgi:hypothetical protein
MLVKIRVMWLLLQNLADTHYLYMYWVKLLNSRGTLAYDAYLEDKAADAAGGRNWVTFIRTLLTRCRLQHIWERGLLQKDSPPIVKAVREVLTEQYEQLAFGRIHSVHGKSKTSGNKLRTYAMLKSEYKIENYLNIILPAHLAQNIARIRTSSHDLEIERGRRVKPISIPADERWCRHCKTTVEDEIHFVTICPLYESYRNELYKTCQIKQQHHQEKDIFIQLFTSTDSVCIRALGVFLQKAFSKRKSWLYH